jgi:hypothetical protein
VHHRNVVYQNIFVSTKSEKRKRRGRNGEKMRLSGTERKDEEKMKKRWTVDAENKVGLEKTIVIMWRGKGRKMLKLKS